MVAVTIAVPVFNGEALLDEALANLATQTFADFKVLIFDNASTDGTEAIASSWVERDRRFHYFRNPENIGALPNFLAALRAADTRWFMWRAYDDLSARNYIEALHRLAVSSPGCQLAVATVVTQDLDGGRRRETRPPLLRPPKRTADILRTLFNFHPSWFYGLWDRQSLMSIFPPLCKRFPYAVGSDILTLYGPIIDGAVRATEDTYFIQRYRQTATSPRRQSQRTSYAEMAATRRTFKKELRLLAAERPLPWSLRVALIASKFVFLHYTMPSVAKMARRRLREVLGMSARRPRPPKSRQRRRLRNPSWQ
jgi:hypothetical protein